MRRSVPRAPILFALLAVAACSRGDRSSPPPPQTSTIHPASPPPRANVEDLRARGRPRPGDASLAFQAKGAALAATNKTLGASVSAEDGAIALAFRGGTRDASLRLLRVGRPGAMEEISGGFKVGCAATPGASCVERTSTEGTLVEWWDNRPDGMEHAFRLDEAPAREELADHGDAGPRVGRRDGWDAREDRGAPDPDGRDREKPEPCGERRTPAHAGRAAPERTTLFRVTRASYPFAATRASPERRPTSASASARP